jgi:hypothetical protein
MRYAGRGHDKKHVDEMRRTKFMSVVVIEQTKNKKQKTKNKKKLFGSGTGYIVGEMRRQVDESLVINRALMESFMNERERVGLRT